MTDDSRNQN